jgi:histidyl-tRNA synthetase
MLYKAPRGTHDLWGAEALKLHNLEELARNIFQKNNYSELRVPTFEDAALFTRSIGETTDIVEKEMYVFTDLKGRKLSLRPEGTASIVRAYLENNLAMNMPVGKFFYIGPMFRYERPQAGRYREFFQIGAEYFANASPACDAEVIIIAHDIISKFGITDTAVHINSLGCAECRPKFRNALIEFLNSKKDLCADCARRVSKNPLRVLDCKIDGPKLKDTPKMQDFLCGECGTHFNRVLELLKLGGLTFEIDHFMVRGLDYYTRTIFELRSSAIGSQDAIAAGGRYDSLVKELGGPATPAVGFALGSERVIMAKTGASEKNELEKPPLIFIAFSSEALENKAFEIAVNLRKSDVLSPEIAGLMNVKDKFSVEGPIADKSLKSQLRLADKLGASYTIIAGEEELGRGKATLRDMKTQTQKEVDINSFL